MNDMNNTYSYAAARESLVTQYFSNVPIGFITKQMPGFITTAEQLKEYV